MYQCYLDFILLKKFFLFFIYISFDKSLKFELVFFIENSINIINILIFLKLF